MRRFSPRFLRVRLAVGALLFSLFTGCVTLKPQERQVLVEHRVPASLRVRMEKREVLSLTDIAQLSVCRVPSEFIIRYVENSLGEYTMTTRDVLALREAGVNERVIDYLLTTGPREQVVVNRYPTYVPYTRTVIIQRPDRR